MHIQTAGLILRETAYRDCDKMLTILTREEGKLSVCARGARRRGSALLASTQLLAYADFKVFSLNGRYSLDDAETLDLFFGLRRNFTAFSLASYCAEMMDAVCVEGVRHDDILRLGIWLCGLLGSGKRPPALVKAAFELRLMALLGFEPHLDFCAACGAVFDGGAAEVNYFHLTQGEVCCERCFDASIPRGEAVGLSAGAYAAMRHIVGCGPNRLCAFTLDAYDARILGEVCERYALSQIGRGFDSLIYYKDNGEHDV